MNSKCELCEVELEQIFHLFCETCSQRREGKYKVINYINKKGIQKGVLDFGKIYTFIINPSLDYFTDEFSNYSNEIGYLLSKYNDFEIIDYETDKTYIGMPDYLIDNQDEVFFLSTIRNKSSGIRLNEFFWSMANPDIKAMFCFFQGRFSKGDSSKLNRFPNYLPNNFEMNRQIFRNLPLNLEPIDIFEYSNLKQEKNKVNFHSFIFIRLAPSRIIKKFYFNDTITHHKSKIIKEKKTWELVNNMFPDYEVYDLQRDINIIGCPDFMLSNGKHEFFLEFKNKDDKIQKEQLLWNILNKNEEVWYCFQIG